jgi:hypothetical protein
MHNPNDFPNPAKLEQLSNFFLRFATPHLLPGLIANCEFTDDIFKEIGLLLHDMRKDNNRSKIATDFIIVVARLAERYIKESKENPLSNAINLSKVENE